MWNIEQISDGVVAVHRIGSQPQPTDWAQHLAGYLTLLGNVQLVGAKRLGRAGAIFSMGEFIVHPKGFHHLGAGSPAEAFRFPEEVDAVNGGAFVVASDAFEAAGGTDRLSGELGGIELSLRIRQMGGRCIVVPDVVVVEDSTPTPSASDVDAFQAHWGFDWNAADLDVVQQRWAGTALLWNVRLHGKALPFEKYGARPGMHWESYATVEVYRQRADHLTKLVAQTAQSACGPVLDLGCGDGLFSHLLVKAGFEVVGIDPEAAAIEQAKQQVNRQTYPCTIPRFVEGDGASLPFKDGSFQAVVLFDVIEHLQNPIRLLREVRRVLATNGHLVVSTPAWQLGAWSDPVYHVTEYTMEELARQIGAAGLEIVNSGTIGGVYRDLVVIARNG